MTTPIRSLIAAGSKVWLDSVDPKELHRNREWGITGATSNPKIIQKLIESGQFDEPLREFLDNELDDEAVAWNMTDHIVKEAQALFEPIWEETKGNDGYVSFELDPLLEDPEQEIPLEERVFRYVELGKKWSADRGNRMIKVPNTPSGVRALPELAAAGVPLNVTLTFTPEQYLRARNAIWQGARQLDSLDRFKSVYSIFVSRVDVYADQHMPPLSAAAQRQLGIVNAKQIWRMHREFWQEKHTPLEQEIVFASTGPKLEGDPPWKYVEAFAGGDILTNPPEVNAAIQDSGKTFTSRIEHLPREPILGELEEKCDMADLERVLMEEGVQKFADPHKELLQLIAQKRNEIQEAATTS